MGQMIIFPAIDLYGGKAVRLFKGDYNRMTVYDENPVRVAEAFKTCGAGYVHIVDLEGARSGLTPNFETIRKITSSTNLFVETGGGIRSMDTIDRYMAIGVGRVILGTAAIQDEALLERALAKYGDKIAAGADLKDGFVAISGWTKKSVMTGDDFFKRMQSLGVRTVICTDVSKDGAMRGTNRALYRELGAKYSVDIIASGGISSLDDVRALRSMELHGAIIGTAYYTGAIDLKTAIEVAK